MLENTTAEETVSALRSLFARMGLPDQIGLTTGPSSHQKLSGSLLRQMVLNMPPVHLTTP